MSGLSWLGDNEKGLNPGSLASRILCSRHNSALSSLDAIAVHLFQAFDEEGVTDSGQQLLHLFSGHDIERWLLKILCGVTYSNNLKLDAEADTLIPRQWLEILFGYTEFRDGQGLYICKSRDHRFEGPRGLMLRAITGRGRLSGLGLWICGVELILSMSGFPTRLFDGREFVYRPLEIYTRGTRFEKSVMFIWDGNADLGTLHVEIAEA